MNKTAMPAQYELASLGARRKSLFWRIHFWAALIASPFALLAALTGILYIFTPQIEQLLYADLDHVQPVGEMRTLDAAISAARLAVPAESSLRSVVPAFAPSDSVRVFFMLPDAHNAHASTDEHAAHRAAPAKTAAANRSARTAVVYVNPYTTAVLGMHTGNERFGAWSKKLHSTLLQSDSWRWLIELAASWLMVMLLTGIYLWWPRNSEKGLPQRGASGRKAWAQWHGFIGVALSVMSFVILTTGLTWSKYAGDQVRLARDSIGQASPQAPRNLTSTIIDGIAPMTWQAAADAARRQAPEIALQLIAPRDRLGTWRVSSYDPAQPKKRVDMMLDAYSGHALFYSDWKNQTAFSKATGIGIPFHRGEFGWWNQLLLLIFGLGIVFSLLSGWVMFFKRRKTGSLGLPKLLPGAWKAMPVGGWICAACLFVAMPLLAISSAALATIEIFLHYRNRKAC
ncbi:putative iron-regulated membrane protein [Herminiimonas arsenicoxydans]|uniref:Iron-regulated membrane protein n=1 Tax=Herminiimonas arsenicoxydans TaxID=204773 RepID=A4G1A6_HERAR|nr:putative iron-regulated membrane protein [Herminiimonas arsenicoxydans]